MIVTTYESQKELLSAVIRLHIPFGRFQLDPTYGKGGLHKGLIQPELRSDLRPQDSQLGVAVRDVRRLPWGDACIHSVIFDPPFLAGGGETSRMGTRYGSYATVPELLAFYREALAELYRVMAKGAVLVFKCQDLNNGRTQGFSHCEIYNQALAAGFYALDLFVLVSHNRMRPHNMAQQDHARKNHCYFWVFEKSGKKNHREKK